MDLAVDQAELFPHIEAKVAKRSPFRKLMDAINEHGPIVTQVMASYVMGISRQRVHQLVADGKLAAVEVNGHMMVPVVSIEAWLAQEKEKGGRPPETLKEMMKHAFKERADAKKRLTGVK